jgi:uncharacterized protein YgbK (DUF1537 family)
MENGIDKWNDVIQSDDEVVLLDALHEGHLQKIGEWLDAQCKDDAPLFSVGSSGIEMALGKHWNKTGTMEPKQIWQGLEKVEQLLVISGSCSPVTKNQIAYAVENGFEEVPLIPETFQGPKGEVLFFRFDESKILACAENKQSLIIHTGKIQGIEQSKLSDMLGSALGSIAWHACDMIKPKRVVVAGGDTSSYIGRVMGIEALEMIAPVVTGAPICKAHAPGSPLDGVEVNFKGGQVGGEDYFVVMMNGEKGLT